LDQVGKTTPMSACSLEEAKLAKSIWSELNDARGVGASRGHFHHSGIWYGPPVRFPGVYFDTNGYIRFGTEIEFKQCHGSHGMRIGPNQDHAHFTNGIAVLHGYVRMKG
jgi:hypothetical protein